MAKKPGFLTTHQAAKQKGVSTQAIRVAARRGAFESIEMGKFTVVIDDIHFKKWKPQAKKQLAGKIGWKKRQQKQRR